MRDFIENYPHSAARTALAPPFSDHVEDVVLPADTLQRVAIPLEARFVLASFDGDVRLRVGLADTTFSLPTVTSGNGNGSELNPSARRIPAALGGGAVPTHLVLRAPQACRGSLAFYR